MDKRFSKRGHPNYMATIKDVAARAGLSTTTVSIIINGKAAEKSIPQTTVDKVHKAMQELNYRPDQYARRLRTGSVRKPVIGFFWPLDHRTNLIGTLVTAMEKCFIDHSYDVDLRIESFTPGALDRHAQSILGGLYDGIIIGATSSVDTAFINSMASTTPVVLFNRASTLHSCVRVDNRMLGLQAASLIRRKGYTECCVIKNEGRYLAMSERTKFFIEACQSLGIGILDEWIFEGPGTQKGGADAALEFVRLSDRPRVIFCEDDFMAQGALVTLHDNGIRVPDDVELLAFGMQSNDNMNYLIPSITTVSLPYMKMMESCVEILMDSIADSSLSPRTQMVAPEVMIRKSFSI